MINILIVEDNENIQLLLEAVLKKHHFIPHLASNGLEALSLMETTNIDLCIVDLMMPEMNGYEFTEHLRQTNSTIPNEAR